MVLPRLVSPPWPWLMVPLSLICPANAPVSRELRWKGQGLVCLVHRGILEPECGPEHMPGEGVSTDGHHGLLGMGAMLQSFPAQEARF